MKCGKPILKMEEEFCYDCSKKKHEFDEGRSIWLHRPPVNEAIYAYKYHGLECYGSIFGAEMAKEFQKFLVDRKTEVLIPIPLYWKRYWERGYNQAEVLARRLGELTGIPVDDVLQRTKATNPQKQLDDKERRKNIQGAFSLKREISYRTAVVIDDIYTTGSTLDEAARVLKKAGVGKVYFLTISIGQGF